MRNDQKDFGARVKVIRKNRGETQDTFGALLGVTKSTVSAYEKGDVFPPFNILNTIVELGEKSFEWLFTGEGDVTSPSGRGNEGLAALEDKIPVINEEVVQYDNPPAPLNDFVRVPRYEVSASAGGGAVVESEQVVDYLMFGIDWVKNTLGANPNKLALISVLGDSMSPSYNDGDLILVDTSSNRPKTDAVYVIQHDSCLWVKRLHFHFDGSVAVISDNPRYPEQTITGEALERLRIVGRVMWRGGK